MPDPSDQDLVRLTREGDAAAYVGLVERYKGSVFNVCYRLLGEQAAMLEKGLAGIDPAIVAQVHATLSREAFFQAVARYGQDLPADRRASLRTRVHTWCMDAERRARDASPYPDAMNWQAAGIVAQEYLAMQDLHTAWSLLDTDGPDQVEPC